LDIELRNGWHWPVGDTGCWDWTNREHDLPEKIMAHVTSFDLCIHAGANAGFYAKAYAKRFKKVIALEPHPVNFRCLCLNVPEDNVIKIYAGLGETHGWGSLFSFDGVSNSGGWKTVPGEDFPILMIDDFMGRVDLIHLDVEGYEFEVLKGATRVLSFNPTVALETINPKKDALAKDLLTEFGYSVKEQLWHDTVYK
jgi:FkbM family methyltransferase